MCVLVWVGRWAGWCMCVCVGGWVGGWAGWCVCVCVCARVFWVHVPDKDAHLPCTQIFTEKITKLRLPCSRARCLYSASQASSSPARQRNLGAEFDGYISQAFAYLDEAQKRMQARMGLPNVAAAAVPPRHWAAWLVSCNSE